MAAGRPGNLNSTVIGDYARPTVRLPGAGGAPEIALGVGDVFVIMRHSTRAFVAQLDFTTSLGDNVRTVVTDLGVLAKVDGELQLVQVHPGVEVGEVVARTGWDLVVSESLVETEPPTELELATLRRLKAEAQR